MNRAEVRFKTEFSHEAIKRHISGRQTGRDDCHGTSLAAERIWITADAAIAPDCPAHLALFQRRQRQDLLSLLMLSRYLEPANSA